jgi:hypothetical protein
MAATIGAGDFLVTCHARDYTAILMFDPLPLFFAVILVAAVYRETRLETSGKVIPELD